MLKNFPVFPIVFSGLLPVKRAVAHNEIETALEVLCSSKLNFQFLEMNFQNERTVRDTIAVARMLLDAGADPHDSLGDLTAFHYAAMQGHLDIVKLLLDRGVDPNVKTSDGSTALHYAAREGRLDIVKLLLDAGVDKNVSNIEGERPIDYACSKNHPEIMKLLEPRSSTQQIAERSSTQQIAEGNNIKHDTKTAKWWQFWKKS